MERNEIPFVLGTAGHIDHGKTELVRALTGVDCDRLKEEKKRGITIELGFAPLVLPDGRIVSIIDVPGHERFIRQMVAGAAGIDAVLFVVAADEGVMPQTREHLEILQLLGVRDGLIVLTKCDLVDGEMLELAKEDVKQLVSGTFLENKPVIPVSAIKRTGLDELLVCLAELASRAKLRSGEGPFFLPIDRAFTIAGFGTVVTGTAYQGSIQEGDEAEILPLGKTVRIRSLQVHGKGVKKATAGQRVAMNLANIGVEELERGDVVCEKELFRPSDCLDVRIVLLSSAPEPLHHWQRVHLLLGTSDVVARVGLLEAPRLLPGSSATAQLLPESPLVAAVGQHFVIRFYSPLRTIGGGEVLLPLAKKVMGRKKREEERTLLLRIQETEDLSNRIVALVDSRGHASLDELQILLQKKREELVPLCESLALSGKIVELKSTVTHFFSCGRIKAMEETFMDKLLSYHRKNPELPGFPLEALNSALPELDIRSLRAFVDFLEREGKIEREKDRIRKAGIAPQESLDFLEKVAKVRKILVQRGYLLPHLEELSKSISIKELELRKIVDYLKEKGEVRLVGEDLLLYVDTEKAFLSLLQGLEGEITVASVRDATGTSRKIVLPVLEYFDSVGITRRVGEKRILRKTG